MGTGGKDHYPVEAPKPNSDVRDGHSHGVLELTLRRRVRLALRRNWRESVRDAVSDICLLTHRARPHG